MPSFHTSHRCPSWCCAEPAERAPLQGLPPWHRGRLVRRDGAVCQVGKHGVGSHPRLASSTAACRTPAAGALSELCRSCSRTFCRLHPPCPRDRLPAGRPQPPGLHWRGGVSDGDTASPAVHHRPKQTMLAPAVQLCPSPWPSELLPPGAHAPAVSTPAAATKPTPASPSACGARAGRGVRRCMTAAASLARATAADPPLPACHLLIYAAPSGPPRRGKTSSRTTRLPPSISQPSTRG